MIQHSLFRLADNQIVDNGTRYCESIKQLQLDCPASDGWLIIPTTDLPSDFSVDTYTIIDGQLTPASPKIIAQRQAIQALANHEATRQARQQRYDSEAVTSLYWNWQESGAKADKLKWLAAKEAIRQELPYATEAEQHENHLKLNNL